MTNPDRELRDKVKKSKFGHAVIDLWVPDASKLEMKSVMRLFRESAKIAGLKVVKLSGHEFSSESFTAFALLSQSHIAIHTWPEYQYVACDLFSCGGELLKATEYLIESLSPKGITMRVIKRGPVGQKNVNSIFLADIGPEMWTMLNVKTLGTFQSEYQAIEILSHEEFGRMLVIDDDIQFTEKDHDLYDNSLLSPLKRGKKCDNILVIGGGDGLCCSYILNNHLSSKIKVLELDPKVVEVCRKFFPRISWGMDSPEVSIEYGDAIENIKRIPDESFDAAILDSTAPDTKWGYGTYSKSFLSETFRVLRQGALLCANGTSIWYRYDLSSNQIENNISNVFGKCNNCVCWIPSFGSPWSFFSAEKKSTFPNANNI